MREAFQPLPESEALDAAWPTRRRDLFEHPEAYIVRTPANPDYGKPGWTRDAGKRLHRGLDIAPVQLRPAGMKVSLLFTDPATGQEYSGEAPTWIPDDDTFAVAAGVIEAAVTREDESDFGRHVLIRHVWPTSGGAFYSLYGHLDSVDVVTGQAVRAGAWLGHMGQTSRSAEARKWMAAFPHLHFEVRDMEQRRYDPLAFLRLYLAAHPG